MFALIPYRVDVPLSRWPIANWTIIAVCVVLFFGLVSAYAHEWPDTPPDYVVFDAGKPLSWVTSTFFHGGLLHLAGNMLFLFVFGNAINHKLGQVGFVIAYLGLGLCGSLAHLAADGRPALGASGAICGLAGMFLIYFPRNDVSCFWWILFRAGSFSCSSVFVLLYFAAWDVLWLVALGSGSSVGHAAHLGGWCSGILLAILLLATGVVKMQSDEQDLLSVLSGR